MSDKRPEVGLISCAWCGRELAARDAVLGNHGNSWVCSGCKKESNA